MVPGAGPVSTPFCLLLNARLQTRLIAAQRLADVVQIHPPSRDSLQGMQAALHFHQTQAHLWLHVLQHLQNQTETERFSSTKGISSPGESLWGNVTSFSLFLWPSREVRPYSDDRVAQKVILKCKDCSCHWFPEVWEGFWWHWGCSREGIRKSTEKQRCLEGPSEGITPLTSQDATDAGSKCSQVCISGPCSGALLCLCKT